MGRGGGWAPWCALLVAAGASGGCGDDRLIGFDTRPGGPALERYRPEPNVPDLPGIEPRPPVDVTTLMQVQAVGGASCAGGPAVLGVNVTGGAPPYTYEWSPPDGLDDPTSPSPTAVSEVGVEYTVTVRDTKGQRARGTTTVQRRALPKLEVGFARGAASSCQDTVLDLDASGTVDADGEPIADVAWDLDGDGKIDATGLRSGAFQPRDGHVVRVTATDAQGCTAHLEQPLEVLPKPTALADRIQPTGPICAGATVRFDGSRSRDAGGSPVAKYSWDLDGDGTNDAGAALTYAFPVTDRQRVRLLVTDSNGCTAATTHQVFVTGLPTPKIDVVGNPVICAGESLQLDGRRSTAPDGGPVDAWAWNLDANPATIESRNAVTHAFQPSGPATLAVFADGCGAQVAQPLTVLGPRENHPWTARVPRGADPMVDVIFVIDNSASMSDEIVAVQNNINTNFAQIMAASPLLDYRIILVSAHGDVHPGEAICIAAPLSGTSCVPVPPAPVNGPRFFHYDAEVSSVNSLKLLIDTYHLADKHHFAPDGWSQWLRPGAKKVFVEITDDDSQMAATTFDVQLRALSQEHFGTAAARNYTWHSIIGLSNNAPATEPWLPADPVQQGVCGVHTENAGVQYQILSRMTGGLRFPICQSGNFDVVFRQIADHVVEQMPLSCSIDVPGGAEGGTVNLTYRPNGTGSPVALARVSSAAACGPAGGYYVDGGVVFLCPATCTAVQADNDAAIDISGCGGP